MTLRPRRRRTLALVAAVVLAGCTAGPSGSPPTATASRTPSASVIASPAGASVIASPAGASVPPTASPEPALSLPLPAARDPRRVRFSVAADLKAGGDGELRVDVENLTATRIDEVVLRWPTALGETLLLAPFTPSRELVREGGKPLHFAWTRWVVGPGELGEPPGTTSLGWGPLLPHARLSIPLVATRRGPGPVAFDLQLLAGVAHRRPINPDGDALLADANGGPAKMRVEVP